MKFLCRNCKAKYQIADEKVAGRTLRMTCQQCGEPIVVRGPARQPLAARPVAPAPMSGLAAPPPASATIAGADLSRLSSAPRESLPMTEEWHVAINDVPVGPLRREEVARKIAQGAVDRESLAWREGMDDWLAVKHIAELSSLFGTSAAAGALSGHMKPVLSVGGLGGAAPVTMSTTAMMRGDTAPIGGRQVVASYAPLAVPDSEPPEVAVATLTPVSSTAPISRTSLLPAPVPITAMPSAAPVPVPAPIPIAPTPAPPAAPAAPAAAPAAVNVAAPVALAPEGSGRPPWAQMFALVSGGALILAAGIFLGVRVLAPATPVPVATAPTEAPAPKKAVEAAQEQVKADEAQPEKAGGMVELDSTAIDGTTTAAASGNRKSTTATATNTNQGSQPKSGEKKASSLTADEKAMIERMGGRMDQGGPSLRAPSEAAHAGSAHGQGTLTAEQLSAVVMGGRKHLQRCYETALRGAQSQDTVRLDVDIEVTPSGNVKTVRTSGKGLPGMDDCIVKTVKMWRFPMSGEVTQTRFPVVFQPGA